MLRYQLLEMYHKKLIVDRRETFYSIVNTIMKEENIILLNYKTCEKISANNFFFNDSAHLNRFGATAFTTMLNHDIYG